MALSTAWSEAVGLRVPLPMRRWAAWPAVGWLRPSPPQADWG